MSLRSFFTTRASKLGLGSWASAAALLGLFAVSAAGCGGCDGQTVQCDADGTCEICDAYGCRPANAQIGNSGGAGGSGTSAGGGGTGGEEPAKCDPKVATCPCDASDECAGDKQCVQGLCIDGCQFSYECGAGAVCFNSGCVPGCDDKTPCETGFKCDKGACFPDPANPECDANKPCADGLICAAGSCTTACTVNADCAAGELCDAGNGACIPDPSPKPVCGPDKACTATQICLEDGFCHYSCTTAMQCKLIDNRFVACDVGVCKTAEEMDPECTIGKPCKAGEDCVSNKCL